MIIQFIPTTSHNIYAFDPSPYLPKDNIFDRSNRPKSIVAKGCEHRDLRSPGATLAPSRSDSEEKDNL